MYYFLKKLISYFRTIEIYEKKTNRSIKKFKKFKFKTFNHFSKIKSKEILNYFNIYKDKKKDLIKT